MRACIKILGVLCAIMLFAIECKTADDDLTEARQILDSTGVKGGLIVHLGCGDGKLTSALWQDGLVVFGLDTDAKMVDTARAHVRSRGLDGGKVTIDRFGGRGLCDGNKEIWSAGMKQEPAR